MINGMMMTAKKSDKVYELTVGSYLETALWGAGFYGYEYGNGINDIGSLTPNDIEGKAVKRFGYTYERGETLCLYFLDEIEDTWAEKIIVKFLDYDDYEVHLYKRKGYSEPFTSEVGSTIPQIFLENVGKTLRITLRKEW